MRPYTALVLVATLLFAGCASPTQPAGRPKAADSSDLVNPVARGEQLFTSRPCASCHTLDGIARGTVGPDLSHVGSVAAHRKPDSSAEDYLRESIVDPDAFTVPGYSRGIMPRIPLEPRQVDDLVAFLRTRQ
jgi:mono/diheme cytochrome c family protein